MTQINPNWQAFLEGQGAIFTGQHQIANFGNPEIELYLLKDGPILSPLIQWVALEVSGEDARDFLQGQLTNDITQITDKKGQIAGYTTPEAKVLNLLLITPGEDESLLLWTHYTLAESLLKRLQMYILRSKVQLQFRPDIVALGYGGEFAELATQRYLEIGELEEDYTIDQPTIADFAQTQVMRIPGPYPSYWIWGPVEKMQNVFNELRLDGEAVGTNQWEVIPLSAGIPIITEATSGEHLAQFLNLDRFGAISFTKGCYTGQEVISKMHYRGKAQKRTYKFYVDAVAHYAPGQVIQLEDDEGHGAQGVVINAQQDSEDTAVMLLLLSNRSVDNAGGVFILPDGSEIQIAPMSYELFDEDDLSEESED